MSTTNKVKNYTMIYLMILDKLHVCMFEVTGIFIHKLLYRKSSQAIL